MIQHRNVLPSHNFRKKTLIIGYYSQRRPKP